MCDVDPDPQDPLWLQYTHTQGLQKSCGGKGMVRPLSQEESARPLPGQAFIVFLGPLHQRRSSFTAKVCFGWLSFADKGEGVTEYIKGGYLQCKGRSGGKG